MFSNKNLIYLAISVIAFVFILPACSSKPKADPEYVKTIEEWHAKRIANLKKETGWLNLAGLLWLEEGDNTFGSGKDNKVIFPEGAPEKIGTIALQNGKLTFISAEGINVKVNDTLTKSAGIKDDMSGRADVMQIDNWRWTIIKRGEKYGIRLRDLNSPLVKSFKGVDRYEIDTTWRITAQFHKFDSAKVISIPNILGTFEDDTAKGELRFSINNKEYSIIPISEGEQLFIIFADETNGEETYGAGRFLYTAAPDENGRVILDFNRAYNPPCAFTKYATCPLPPKENRIRTRITAGEKNYGEGH